MTRNEEYLILVPKVGGPEVWNLKRKMIEKILEPYSKVWVSNKKNFMYLKNIGNTLSINRY